MLSGLVIQCPCVLFVLLPENIQIRIAQRTEVSESEFLLCAGEQSPPIERSLVYTRSFSKHHDEKPQGTFQDGCGKVWKVG